MEHAPSSAGRGYATCSPLDRACVAFDLDAHAADAALRLGPGGVDEQMLAQRTSLDVGEVRRLLRRPEALEARRWDPNRLSAGQIARLPMVPADRIGAVIRGRPYFSMAELEAASGVPGERLGEMIQLPAYELVDHVASTRRQLDPARDAYLLAPSDIPHLNRGGSSFEAAIRNVEAATDTAARLGWLAPTRHPPGLPRRALRVVGRSSLESASPAHELKQALPGRVFPVLVDPDGFRRLLVPGAVDIWFEPDVTAEQARRVLAELGLEPAGGRPQIGYWRVILPNLPLTAASVGPDAPRPDTLRATLQAAASAGERDEVRFAEPEQVSFDPVGPDFHPAPNPLATSFESTSTVSRDWHHTMIGTADAHAVTTGSPEVTVVVIDSGLRLDHPDLTSALQPNWRDLDLNYEAGVPDAEASPADPVIGHGTAVAGTASGRAAAGTLGVRGVAPGCWLLPVKISGHAGDPQSYALRAAAILEAATFLGPGRRGVINLSWATDGEHIAIREALRRVTAAGLAVVTSAGNYWPDQAQSPDRPHYPSGHAPPADELASDGTLTAAASPGAGEPLRIPGVCSVAALNASGRRASYSYHGPRWVTLAAPGGEMSGLGPQLYVPALGAEGYAYNAGTSFAAPQVAGALALLLSLDPSLTPGRAVRLLCDAATPPDPADGDATGAGGLDIAAALHALQSTSANGEPAITPPVLVEHPAEESNGTGRVNVNTASTDRLAAVPLLGPWSAGLIVADREANGPFTHLDDLLRTAAIDTWTLDRLRDHLTVTDTPAPPSGNGHDRANIFRTASNQPPPDPLVKSQLLCRLS